MQYMYEGETHIEDSNVFKLLQSSDYLQLQVDFIEMECIKRLRILTEKYKEPVTDGLKILNFSIATKNDTLVSLLNQHISEHLDFFLKDIQLMELSFDDVNRIMKCKRPATREFLALELINRWIDHSRTARKKYREELMKSINHKKIHTSYFLSLILGYENFLDGIAIGKKQSAVILLTHTQRTTKRRKYKKYQAMKRTFSVCQSRITNAKSVAR